MLTLAALTVMLFLQTLLVQPVWPSPPEEPVDVENPVYANWKNFDAGTIVRYRQVTRTPDFEEKRILIYELKARSESEMVIEFRNYVEDAGEDSANSQQITARRFFRLPPGVSKSDFGKPKGRTAEGKEKLSLLGTEYEADWNVARVQVEAGTTESKSWSSAAVPGGLLKSVSDTPAVKSTTTVELIGLDIKKPQPQPAK